MPRQKRSLIEKLEREIARKRRREEPQKEGALVTYIVCPLCGRNRVLETYRKGTIRWDYFDPETSPIIQFRRAGGRIIRSSPDDKQALGFRFESGLSWREAESAGSEYQAQLQDISKQIHRVYEYLMIKNF
jgi:hypothetical protein